MKRLWITLLFMSLSFLCSSAAEKSNNYEEGVVYLRFNNRFGDTFFPVLFKGNGKEVYVEVEELLELMGTKDLTFDPEAEVIEGKLFYFNEYTNKIEVREFNSSLINTKKMVVEGRVYVEAESLSRILPFETVAWKREKYLLDVTLDFLLPIEANEIQERERSKLNGGSEEKDVIRNERKLISPGILQLRYFVTDFSDRDEEDTFEINYFNQLFYGDFTIQTELKPDREISYIALKYDDIIEGKSIIIGDATFQSDNIFSVENGDFTGLSIVDDEVFITEDRNRAVIEGQVLNGTTVELYQNEILLAFQRVRTGNGFKFEDVPILGFSDEYTLKFYYPDGSYEERKVSLLDDSELQKKGESNYHLQAGEMSDEFAFSGRYLYGVTDNLTLGAGYFKGDSTDNYIEDERYNYSVAETSLIYRTRAQKNPTLYSFKFFTDIDEAKGDDGGFSDVSFKGRIFKTLFGLDFQIFYDEYSDTLSEGEESDRRYGAIMSDSIGDFSYNISYEREEEFSGDTDEYGLDIRYSFTQNLLLFVDNNYKTYSDERLDRYRGRLNLAYSGFRNVNVNLLAETEIDEEDHDERYEVRVSRKYRNFSKGDLDFAASVAYDSDEWVFSLFFEYYLTNWLSVPAFFTQDDQEVGLALDKTINLAKPFSKSSNPAPESAWMEGVVYSDENGNGVYDDGEMVFEGLEIRRGGNGQTQVVTDENGYYYIDDLPSDSLYEFLINKENLDPMVKPAKDSYSVLLRPASGYRLDVPLLPVSAVMGNIVFKGAGNVSKRELAIAYQQTRVYLKRDDVIIQEVQGEIDGFFIFNDVLPGRYELEIKYLGDEGYIWDKQVYDINIDIKDAGEYYEGYEFYLRASEEGTGADKVVLQ